MEGPTEEADFAMPIRCWLCNNSDCCKKADTLNSVKYQRAYIHKTLKKKKKLKDFSLKYNGYQLFTFVNWSLKEK